MQHCTARLLTWARVIGLLLAMSSVLCRAQTASWGAWSSWSECSKNCSDEGVRSRTRKCSSSTQPCSGSGSGYKACDNINCGEWSQWSSWSSCVATCDRVEKTRLRSCLPKHPNAVRILLYCGDAAERFESKTCPGTTVRPIASPQPQILSTVSYFYPMGSPAEEFSTALLTCCVQSTSVFNLQFVSAKTGSAVGNSSTTRVLSSVNEVTVIFAPVQLADHGKYSCKDVVPLGSPSKVIEETKHLQVTAFVKPTPMTPAVNTTEMPTPSSTPSFTPTTKGVTTSANSAGTTLPRSSSSSSSSASAIGGAVAGGVVLIIIIVVVVVCRKRRERDVTVITLPMLQRPSTSASTQQAQSPAGAPAAQPQLAEGAEQSASATTSKQHRDSEQRREQENQVEPVDQG